jgi:hypothetical protein
MDVEKAVHGLTIGLVSVSNQKEGMPKLNVGSFDLGDHDRDWFIVMSRLGDRSIRANLSSVVGYYVRRRKSEYEAILDYTARKYGLTPEECFKKLLNGEDLGKPVDGFSEPPPEVPEEG